MNQSRIAPVIAFLKDGGARLIGYIVAIGMVAAVAARVSYSHIRDVTLIAGQSADVAALLPLSVDGMLLAATLAMSQDKANGRQPRGWARIGFWLGATISVLCNVADTLVHASEVIAAARAVVLVQMLPDEALLGLAIFVAILAPVILLITVEIMARPGKPIEDGQAVQPAAETRQKTEEERLEERRRRQGYYDKDPAGKAQWTREDNKRQARRKERVAVAAPFSPGPPVVNAPTVAEVAEVVG